MSWTPEKVEKLKELWGKGNTASEIAQLLGGVTRNAVIGKAHRLNLSGKIQTKKSSSLSASNNDNESYRTALIIAVQVASGASMAIDCESIRFLCSRTPVKLPKWCFSLTCIVRSGHQFDAELHDHVCNVACWQKNTSTYIMYKGPVLFIGTRVCRCLSFPCCRISSCGSGSKHMPFHKLSEGISWCIVRRYGETLGSQF